MSNKCQDCKNLIKERNLRCSICAKKRRAIINAACFERRNKAGLRHITASCTYCKKDYKRDKYSKGNPFCSSICKGQFVFNQKQNKRKLLFEKGKLKYRRRLRAILLERFGSKCQICNNTKWNNQPIPLQVDHIDGNSTNNLPNNLRMICHNCDALLPTFAGKNRGYGRISRGLKPWA
jgi:hypothetical protein